jgi:hypothetical protein
VIRSLTWRQRLACLLPIVLAFAIAGVGIATRPGRDPVCQIADRIDAAGLAVKPKAGAAVRLTVDDLRRVLDAIDFTLLRQRAPADLQDEVALVRREAHGQIARFKGGDVSDALGSVDPTFLVTVSRIFDWIGQTCS